MISFELSKELYDKEAILETAHLFTEKCYVDIADCGAWKLTIKSKNEGPPLPNNLKDDFINKLSDQQIRIRMDQEFGPIRNEIVKKAFSPIKN